MKGAFSRRSLLEQQTRMSGLGLGGAMRTPYVGPLQGAKRPLGPRCQSGPRTVARLTPSALVAQKSKMTTASDLPDHDLHRSSSAATEKTRREQLGARVAMESAHLPGRIAPERGKGARRTTWTRGVNAKREKARRRLGKFSAELRASIGLTGILEGLSMGKSGPDYRRRANMFWAFVTRHQLRIRPMEALDRALSDYSDFAYLAGESCEHGDKLKAALAALHPQLAQPGQTSLPHFGRTLKG